MNKVPHRNTKKEIEILSTICNETEKIGEAGSKINILIVNISFLERYHSFETLFST